MIGILFIGLLIALAAYFMLVKTWGAEPKKARKQEKSEIIRQLLALSEQENSISQTRHRRATSMEADAVGSSKKS